MSVSVVIPVYNRITRLARAIDSVLCQPEATQIIVVDDGSDRDIQRVVEKYGPKLSYIRQNQLGVSATRHQSLKRQSKVEYNL